MRRLRAARAGGLALLGGLLGIVLTAAPAGAILTQNGIGCDGSAVITDGGARYSVNARDAVAKVPRQGTAAWQGSITRVTHDHNGRIALMVGPLGVPVARWGVSSNSDDESEASGTKTLPDALGEVPPGKYDVSGFHQGKEGRCAGKVTVEVQGAPLGNPIVLGSLALSVLSGAGLFAALRAVPFKSVRAVP